MSYWNNNGLNELLGKQLQEMIPAEGSVVNPRKNPKLERFRKAQNCYYDLYNNGLCNRKSEFRTVFGFSSSTFKQPFRYGGSGEFREALYIKAEEGLDLIILEAAVEQKLIKQSALL